MHPLYTELYVAKYQTECTRAIQGAPSQERALPPFRLLAALLGNTLVRSGYRLEHFALTGKLFTA